MATAEQIKSLIRSHYRDESDRFQTTALQLAAHEARQGHAALAHDIRRIVDSERKKKGPSVITFPQDLRGLVLTESPDISLSSLVITDAVKERLQRITHEYLQQDKLKSHGLQHRRKILLVGPPGTGKTMTAKVLAHKLKLKLNTIQVDRLVTRFMGETSAKLRQIFDLIQQEHGVYLFDEFDAIGGDRSADNDVGEMRRVLNAFLQFIEQDHSDSLIVAATNHPHLLDKALFRRFEDVLHYTLPDESQRQPLIKNLLGTFLAKQFDWKQVLKASEGLCHAEIDQACRDAIKMAILNDWNEITAEQLLVMIHERLLSQREVTR